MSPIHNKYIPRYLNYTPIYFTDVLTRTFQSVLTILDIKWTHSNNTNTSNTSDYMVNIYIQHTTQSTDVCGMSLTDVQRGKLILLKCIHTLSALLCYYISV